MVVRTPSVKGLIGAPSKGDLPNLKGPVTPIAPEYKAPINLMIKIRSMGPCSDMLHIGYVRLPHKGI